MISFFLSTVIFFFVFSLTYDKFILKSFFARARIQQ